MSRLVSVFSVTVLGEYALRITNDVASCWAILIYRRWKGRILLTSDCIGSLASFTVYCTIGGTGSYEPESWSGISSYRIPVDQGRSQPGDNQLSSNKKVTGGIGIAYFDYLSSVSPIHLISVGHNQRMHELEYQIRVHNCLRIRSFDRRVEVRPPWITVTSVCTAWMHHAPKRTMVYDGLSLTCYGICDVLGGF